MMDEMKQSNEMITKTPSTEVNYLLHQEAFEQLKQAQQRIKEKADMIPSMRKMINALVNQDAVEKMTQQMIEQYRDI